MALYNSITIGNGRKSLGNVTLLKLKTQNVAKQKISSMSNPKTSGQVTQRGKLSNVVKCWGYVSAFLAQAVSLARPTESIYNAWVRIFVKLVPSTAEMAPATILHGIPVGNYGSGAPLTIEDYQTGAAGLTINFISNLPIYPSSSQVKAMLVTSSGNIVSANQVMGTDLHNSILIPYPGISAGDIVFTAFYVTDEMGTKSSPIQVLAPGA